MDCGSSSTKVLIEKGPGTKEFADEDSLARIDCVLGWDSMQASDNPCKKDRDKGVGGNVAITQDAYTKSILDQIDRRKTAVCPKFYIAMFATGGMRQNEEKVVEA